MCFDHPSTGVPLIFLHFLNPYILVEGCEGSDEGHSGAAPYFRGYQVGAAERQSRGKTLQNRDLLWHKNV